MAAETTKAGILLSPSEGNSWEKMIEYIDDQLDHMKSLNALDFINEQSTNYVFLMKLPENLSNAIRNGLRILEKTKVMRTSNLPLYSLET